MAFVECVMNIRPRKLVFERTYGREAAWSMWKLIPVLVAGVRNRWVLPGNRDFYVHNGGSIRNITSLQGIVCSKEVFCILISCTFDKLAVGSGND